MLLNKKRFERASPPCSYLSVLSLIRLSCQEPHEDSPLHAREKEINQGSTIQAFL